MRLLHYQDADGSVRVGLAVPGRDGFVGLDAAAEWAGRPDLGRVPSIDALLDDGLLPAIGELAAALADSHRATAAAPAVTSFSEVRKGPPLLRPRKIIGVGMNYADHAAEVGSDLPAEPVFFAKFANTLIGDGDDIVMPAVSDQIDWEAELVVVIGSEARRVESSRAMAHVAGYTVGNDVTARDWQLRKPLRQWMLGKTFDTFLPLGPMLVTADEIAQPQALALRCEVNGEAVQDAKTALHFGIADLIAYLSQVLTLQPGDLILTGTPAGVGMSRKPPRYLRPGDTLTTSIEGLGTLRNPVVAQKG